MEEGTRVEAAVDKNKREVGGSGRKDVEQRVD